jgi:hypothetical protein
MIARFCEFYGLRVAQKSSRILRLPSDFATGYSEATNDREPDRRPDLRGSPTDLALIVSLSFTCARDRCAKSQSGFLRDDFWEHRGVSIGQAQLRHRARSDAWRQDRSAASAAGSRSSPFSPQGVLSLLGSPAADMEQAAEVADRVALAATVVTRAAREDIKRLPAEPSVVAAGVVLAAVLDAHTAGTRFAKELDHGTMIRTHTDDHLTKLQNGNRCLNTLNIYPLDALQSDSQFL